MTSLNIIIAIGIALILISHNVHSQDPLTNQELVCISTTVGSISNECTELVSLLANLYNSDDPLLSISENLEQFPVFCNPQCGQAIVDAWQSCEVFDAIAPFANLFIGMCATNAGGSICYTMYNELIAFIRTIDDCGSMTSCSTQCTSDINQAVDDHGCCVNVPLLFEGSMDEDFTEVSVAAFFRCGVSRPGLCTVNAFNNLPPPPTLPPSSPRPSDGSQQPPGAQPSKGVGHVATLLQVVVLCFSVVIMM